MASSTIPNYAIAYDGLNPFLLRGAIGTAPFTSTDFNDYGVAGTYLGSQAQTYSHAPNGTIGDNGFLVVIQVSSDKLTQFWFSAYTGSLNKRSATISGSSVSWTNWTTATFA